MKEAGSLPLDERGLERVASQPLEAHWLPLPFMAARERLYPPAVYKIGLACLVRLNRSRLAYCFQHRDQRRTQGLVDSSVQVCIKEMAAESETGRRSGCVCAGPLTFIARKSSASTRDLQQPCDANAPRHCMGLAFLEKVTSAKLDEATVCTLRPTLGKTLVQQEPR